MSEHREADDPAWVVWLGAAVGLAWLAAHALPMPAYPEGSDWGQYFGGAAHFWLDDAYPYPSWRRPAYPALIGLLGTQTSYVAAAHAVSAASVLVTVLAAAVSATWLAGRRAGAIAAATTPALPFVSEATHWASVYPALGAAHGLALMSAVGAWKTGRSGWAAAAGAFTGVAGTFDTRGLVVGLIVAPLVIAGAPDRRRSAALLLIAALLVGGAARIAEGSPPGRTPFPEQVAEQREVSLREIAAIDPSVRACAPMGRNDNAYSAECSWAILRHNARTLLWLPGWPLVLLGLIGLAYADRRARVAIGGLLAAHLLVVMGIGAMVMYVDRYALQFVAAWGALFPAAIAAGSRSLPVRAVVPAVIAAQLSWILWNPPPELPTPREAWIVELGARLRPYADRGRAMDCTGLHIAMAQLPTPDPGLQSAGPHEPACVDWVQQPPRDGRVLLTARAHRGGPQQSAISTDRIASLGWSIVDTIEAPGEDFLVWVRQDRARAVDTWREGG